MLNFTAGPATIWVTGRQSIVKPLISAPESKTNISEKVLSLNILRLGAFSPSMHWSKCTFWTWLWRLIFSTLWSFHGLAVLGCSKAKNFWRWSCWSATSMECSMTTSASTPPFFGRPLNPSSGSCWRESASKKALRKAGLTYRSPLQTALKRPVGLAWNPSRSKCPSLRCSLKSQYAAAFLGGCNIQQPLVASGQPASDPMG